ncbi:MAG: glycoside hydrolase family 88 protein [Clostridia bacterium]|nr:glycoside hydrolase family 88 protein [Clostridia bacterium]
MKSQIQLILNKMKNLQSDGTVEETCPISIISMDAWEWPQGVALFAMYQYYQESGDKSVFEYLKQWFDKQFKKGLPEQNINTTCPMLTLACLYEETKNEAYLPYLNEWLNGAMHKLPRTEEGGLQHIVSGILNEGQLWDDTLYMTVLFIAKMGNILNNEACIQESIRQFMVHIKYLSDVKTGLFFHGWSFKGYHHFANALWGRGNSWYTAGLVDYLECLKDNDGVKSFLLATLYRQVEALAKCQDESGLWHTILDDEGSYLETSATCAFAYGILKAVRKGYLPAHFALVGEKAVKGVMNQISDDGVVNGVSYGTPVFSTIQEYKDIPICPMPYGQSMALMMLVEAYRGRN